MINDRPPSIKQELMSNIKWVFWSSILEIVSICIATIWWMIIYERGSHWYDWRTITPITFTGTAFLSYLVCIIVTWNFDPSKYEHIDKIYRRYKFTILIIPGLISLIFSIRMFFLVRKIEA